MSDQQLPSDPEDEPAPEAPKPPFVRALFTPNDSLVDDVIKFLQSEDANERDAEE